MILTQCAVCATELGLSLGKKCGRCSTRYCGAECQVQHWKEGGHDKLCKPIKRAGGAEQYNANQKYTEAVAVAAEKCAEDTKGPDVLHLHAGPPLEDEGGPRARVLLPRDGRLCARVVLGGAGEDLGRREENNLDEGVEREVRAVVHVVCVSKQYHGVVKCALRWACWKTNLGLPEADWARGKCDEAAREPVYTSRRPPRGGIVRSERPSWLRCGALAHQKQASSMRRRNLAITYGSSDGLKGPCLCSETYTPDV